MYINTIKILIIIIMILLLLNSNKKDEFSRIKKNEQSVYLSLTTIPERSKNLDKIVKKLLTLKNIDKIVLNCPDYSSRFDKNYEYPENLELLSDKIIINKCKDYGPITKLYPTLLLKEIKNDDIIIIIDDDITYNNNLIKNLISIKNSYPYDVICSQGYSFKKFGPVTIPYILPSGYVNVLQGFGGVAFYRNMFDIYLKEHMDKNEKFRNVDDLVISSYLKKKDIKIKKILDYSIKINLMEQGSGLVLDNFRNMRQLKAINELF